MPDQFEMVPLKSSNLVAAGYDDATREMQVEFNSGTYIVSGVPRAIFDGLISATSPGGYYHRNIRDVFPARRI